MTYIFAYIQRCLLAYALGLLTVNQSKRTGYKSSGPVNRSMPLLCTVQCTPETCWWQFWRRHSM